MEKRNQIDVEPNSQKMKSTDVKDSGSQTCLLMVRKAHPPMVPQTIKAKVETSISELNVLQQKMSILDQLSGHFAMYVTLLVISLTVTLLISLKREFERIKRDNGIRIKYEKHEDKVQETAE